MQLSDIVTGFETARRLPKAELAAATEQAAALAPLVIDCMRRAADGQVLLPREESLLFYGVHALAAARHAPAFAPLIAMLRADPAMVDRMFGDAITTTVPGLVISLFDGDAQALFDAMDDEAADGFVRWSLFRALAWLAWQGRVPMEAATRFLADFDAADVAPADDPVWGGWEEAMTLLGQTELEARIIHRAQQVEPLLRRFDVDEIRRSLAEATADPEDGARFEAALIAPVEDAAAALAWVPPELPAIKGALDPGAIWWLRHFLASDEAPSLAMAPEELDGFLTGLAALPAPVPPSEYVPLVWNEPGGAAPPIEGAEKLAFIEDILARYPGELAGKLAAAQPYLAPIERLRDTDPDGAPLGMDWAQGFLRAMSFDRDRWNRLGLHPVHGSAADVIARAAEGRPDNGAAQSEPVRLNKSARVLGDAARVAYRFFRDLPPVLPANSPLRAAKIGRNDPCPCGSGKKYKKCCGAAA